MPTPVPPFTDVPAATAFLNSVRTILTERIAAIERVVSETERLLGIYRSDVNGYRADLDALIIRARLSGQLPAVAADVAAIEALLVTQSAEVIRTEPVVAALRGATDTAKAALTSEVTIVDEVLADGTPSQVILETATDLRAVPLAALDLSSLEPLQAAAEASLRLTVLARNSALRGVNDLRRAL